MPNASLCADLQLKLYQSAEGGPIWIYHIFEPDFGLRAYFNEDDWEHDYRILIERHPETKRWKYEA